MHLFASLMLLLASPKWIVYYSDEASLEAFRPYQWIVLDRFNHPPVRGLVEEGRIVFGYVTLGEVDDYEPWFKEVKSQGLLLKENPNWPESRFVNMKDFRWQKRVIEEIIPFVLHKGFNGLFLDTLDNASAIGMEKAAIHLVKAIRTNFPQIPLMVNRGFDILEEIAPYIDFVVAEDLFSGYNFKTNQYIWTPLRERKEILAKLEAVKKINPRLNLLSLDYRDGEDREGIKKIYEEAKELGLAPYVGTIDLDQIIQEP